MDIWLTRLNRNERTTLYLKLVKRAKKKRMQFGDLNVAAGLQALDGHLADKSYIGGYLPTQADVTVLKAMSGAPGGDYVNALRWFKHLTSFAAAESAKFGKADFEVVVGGGAAPARPAKKGGGRRRGG